MNRHDGLLSLAAGTLIFYAAARFLDSWAKVRVFLVAGVTSAVLISIYGIAQNFGLDPVSGWDVPWFRDTGRAFSTIGNPIFLAAYLTLMMGGAIAVYFKTETRWERILWLSALALIGACWLYTYTRGAMLGVGVALPVILWLAHRRTGTIRPLLIPLATVAAAVVVAAVLSNTTNSSRSMTGEDTSLNSSLGVFARLYMWRDTIPMILERPLLGHGPDNFAEPFESYEGEDLKAALFDSSTGKDQTVDKAHNEFLQVAATTGLLGLAVYVWIFVSYFREAYRSGGWTIVALSGGTLSYILQFQTAFATIATGVTFWAILGVSVAMIRLQEWEGAKEGPKPSASEGIEVTPGTKA